MTILQILANVINDHINELLNNKVDYHVTSHRHRSISIMAIDYMFPVVDVDFEPGMVIIGSHYINGPREQYNYADPDLFQKIDATIITYLVRIRCTHG